ncbi:MAG: HD domain-containing protein [Nitrospirae bacterium]|nr:HD domain-containing protein [Nitrospirota bacterium]
MNGNDLNFFKNWFASFTKSFYFKNEEDQQNIILKVEHTYNVCVNIIKIAGDLGFDDNAMMLAETTALFHDLGRFPQYAKYKTFKDNISINHGLLGARTLIEEKILQRLSEKEQNLIVQAVKFHNTFRIPKLNNDAVILFLKLIRDADKLDILRVFIEYYETPLDKRASAAGLGLIDSPEYSKEILTCFHKRQIPSYTTLKTLCDFKLMKLTWLYDLNFQDTFKLLLERNYINRLVRYLPDAEEINRAVEALKEFVRQKASAQEVF